jgi:ferritin-like protein
VTAESHSAGDRCGRRTATSRRLLLAAGAAPLALAAVAAAAPRSDPEILERLLALEHRLESAYEAAVRRNVLDVELGLSLLDQEREHVRGLRQTLAGWGRHAPRVGSPDPRLAAALRAREAFARYALDLEGRAVRAYVDAGAHLRDTDLLVPLGAIMASEAQHQVALRGSLGENLLGV